MKAGFLFILTLIWSFGNAQFMEDFSDGDLSQNPTWVGDTNKFTITNQTLQSTSIIPSDVFYCSTPMAIVGDAEWEFWINLQLSTSSANYVDVFLVSDSVDLTKAKNGFFVRIGNTKDEVSLYKLDNGVESLLFDGADGKTHNKKIRIRVIKESFNWQLWIDYEGGNLFVWEGNGTSFGSTTGNFGFLIKQSTATFHKKHFFDDIYVGPKRVDTTLAKVTSIDWINPDQLQLTFDDIVVNSPQTTYTLSNGYGNPDNVTGDFNTNQLILSFSNALINGNYTLTINNLYDSKGNNGDTTIVFSLYQYIAPTAGDIVISEIFADPSPSVGLPDEEFVELFNTTADTLTLESCTFSDGGSPVIFAAITINPYAYLILCKEGNEALFSSFGSVLELPSFPTLNNAGDDLELRNKDGVLLDAVSYTDNYYKDDVKKQGGYSLELIDTNNSCSEFENWTASNAAIGGSPGSENSVFGVHLDQEPPQIIKSVITSTNEITILFNEEIIAPLATDLINFELGSFGINPINITNTIPNQVVLEFQDDLNDNSYIIKIIQLQDCKGNTSLDTEIRAVRIGSVMPGDVLINELLFNPNKDGVDFIELYNSSQHFISFDSLKLGSVNSNGSLSFVQLANYVLAPSSYVAVSSDTVNIRLNYPLTKTQVEIDKTPAMNDDKGNVVLYSNNKLIDSVAYSEEQHFELLNSTEGVSLERIDLKSKGLNTSNWTSASSSAGFATPGYQNSQYVDVTASDLEFELESKTFSPDGDGYQDVLILKYQFGTTDNTINGYVYNLNGALIAHPFNNQTLATSGTISWDGVKANGEKLAVGNYILFIETFNLDGKVVKKKLAFSVVGIF